GDPPSRVIVAVSREPRADQMQLRVELDLQARVPVTLMRIKGNWVVREDVPVLDDDAVLAARIDVRVGHPLARIEIPRLGRVVRTTIGEVQLQVLLITHTIPARPVRKALDR